MTLWPWATRCMSSCPVLPHPLVIASFPAVITVSLQGEYSLPPLQPFSQMMERKGKKERKQHRPCLFLSIAPNGFSRHQTLKADLPSQTGFFLYPTPWISGNVQNRITPYALQHISCILSFLLRWETKNTWESSDISSQGCIFSPSIVFVRFESKSKFSSMDFSEITKPHSVKQGLNTVIIKCFWNSSYSCNLDTNK